MELTMFERLLQLPLFQGLTYQELSDVLAHVRLNFVKHHAGDDIVTQDEPCKNLIYIISGDITTEYTSAPHNLTLKETLHPIGLIEPYNLFGMYQRYSRTYTFATEGITLPIPKQVVLQRLMASTIVKINLLNIVCNRYQQTSHLLRNHPEQTISDKIHKFILAHSSIPRGYKEIHIKMTDLASHIHETRLNVSQTLNEMQKQGIVSLRRGCIVVPDIKAFTSSSTSYRHLQASDGKR